MMNIDEILSAALLGTACRKVSEKDFPELLRADVGALMESGADYEDAFLKAASMVFACNNSGLMPQDIGKQNVFPEALPETSPYIPDVFVSLLIYLNDNALPTVFRYVLWWLRGRREVFPPYALPYFVGLAYTSGSKYMYQYRFAIWPLLGNRGKWLIDSLQLGGEKFVDSSHALRLRMFVAMRKAAFRGSANQLRPIWESISEKQRNDFLSVFMRVWKEDVDFLWDVFQDSADAKSGMMALQMLARNAESPVVRYFEDILDKSLYIDGRRHCDFQPIEDLERLGKYGISGKVSEYGNSPAFISKLPEQEVVIFRLVQSVPLSFWMGKLGCDAMSANKFLLTNPAFRIGFDFKSVIVRFCDGDWAVEYCIYHSRFYIEFVPFLSVDQLERISDYCDMDTDFRITEKMCGGIENYEPWGNKFSTAVFKYIIRTRNFDNSVTNAQFLATKLSKSVDYLMQSYIDDNYGNDIVVAFLIRVLNIRKNLRNIRS